MNSKNFIQIIKDKYRKENNINSYKLLYEMDIIQKLENNKSGTQSVCFSPNSKYVAIGFNDSSAIIWDIH